MKVGLLVRIETKPEYADEVEAMLRGAQELAERRLRGRAGTPGAPGRPDRRGAGGGRGDEAQRSAGDCAG
jgi:hypothetical protein